MTSPGPGSDSSQDVIYTPAESTPPVARSPSRASRSVRPLPLPQHTKENTPYQDQHHRQEEVQQGFGGRSRRDLHEESVMSYTNNGYPIAVSQIGSRHIRSRSNGSRSSERPVSTLPRATLSSRSPRYDEPEDQTKKKYIYAAICLVISLVSFVVQTETAVYIQHELHWNKAYCMLWLTHGSWSLLWPTQLLFLRLQDRSTPWRVFWRNHASNLRDTAQTVRYQILHPQTSVSPWRYMARITAGVTTFLTVAGGSWYVAVDLTTPSDLTAIYNCSAFFAYVFSILLLNDKPRWDKIISVAMAIVGVLVVAYGDAGNPKHGSHSGGATDPNHDQEPDNRLLGNLIIGVGSVMYGLYEVLYKKYACPPEGTSPNRGMIFANTFGSMIGTFTLCVLWIPLPFLHYFGIERFELPRGKAASLLFVSTLSNAVFSGAFLVLMSLTSPVLSSVAALLTIFLVAITDYFLTGEPLSAATISGGLLIIVAFILLSWATYREMMEEEGQRGKASNKDFDEAEAMLEADRLSDDMTETSGDFRKNSHR